jgi:hypothetical protein
MAGEPSLSERTRCPYCGLRSFGPVCRCRFHPQSHAPRSFCPRCALCWAEVWVAIARSFYLCGWRAFRQGMRQTAR